MSDTSQSERIPSEQQLVDWLKVKPRTFGWSAVLAYDRVRANTLLLQEYIDRHSSEEDAFEHISGEMVISAGKHWSYFNDVVLDAPRLSFERSTISNSLATLTLRITGGSHMTVVQGANGPRKVERIDWYDPLQGPKLIVGIRLNDTDGSVSEDGRVKLNLAAGVDIRLTLGTSENEQEEGGRFFQQIFDKWPENKKVLVLNELGQVDGAEFLNPDQFRLRGVPAPGANVRRSSTYGDGAVTVFVSAVGSEVGLTPDNLTEMMFPVPKGRSSTVLIGNYYLVKNLIGAKCWDRFHANLAFDNDNPLAAIKSGTIEGEHWTKVEGHWSPFIPFGALHLYTDMPLSDSPGTIANLSLDVSKGTVDVRWEGENEGANFWAKVSTSDPDTATDVGMKWSYTRAYRFGLTDSGALGLIEIADDSVTDLELYPMHQLDPALDGWSDLMFDVCSNHIKNVGVGRLSAFVDPTAEFNMFRLHGLLFRSSAIVDLKAAHFPCDLAVFGDLGPSATAFELEPLEDVIGAGTSIAMKAVPPQAGLTWKVEGVTGFEGDIGSISETGVYQAPTMESAHQRYTMVRITGATATASSSALMRVVRSDVALNPLVVTASSTSGKIQMAAGSVDGGELTWSLKSATGAELTEEPPEEGEYDDGERFYVPGPGTSGKPFSVDEVTVVNPRSGASHTSYVLRVETGVSGKVYIAESDLPARKVRLEFDNNMGPIKNTVWTVIAGGGSVDDEGVFTADEDSVHKFAIVTAYFLIENVAELTNFIILPIPLVDLG